MFVELISDSNGMNKKQTKRLELKNDKWKKSSVESSIVHEISILAWYAFIAPGHQRTLCPLIESTLMNDLGVEIGTY